MDVLKLKMLAGSAEPTLYKGPEEFQASGGFFVSFSVSPSGDLWMIGESREREYFLFSFDSNGDLKGKSRIEAPEHLDILDFAVSDKGIMLISGHFNRDAAGNLPGQSFSALMDSSGKIRKKFDVESEKFDFHAQHVPESAVVFGDDGLLYLLQPSGIYVISQAGALVRHIKFAKPPEFSAVNLAVSGGYLAVWLSKDNKNGPLTFEYLVIDANTGESLGLYKSTAEMGDALCYSRKEGFTMRQIENHRIRLTMASPR